MHLEGDICTAQHQQLSVIGLPDKFSDYDVTTSKDVIDGTVSNESAAAAAAASKRASTNAAVGAVLAIIAVLLTLSIAWLTWRKRNGLRVLKPGSVAIDFHTARVFVVALLAILMRCRGAFLLDVFFQCNPVCGACRWLRLYCHAHGRTLVPIGLVQCLRQTSVGLSVCLPACLRLSLTLSLSLARTLSLGRRTNEWWIRVKL